MDDKQTSAIEHIRKRHEDRITEQAERIKQHIGYVLKRIEAGRADSVGIYAEDIEHSARRMLLSVVALVTLTETDAILKSGGESARLTLREHIQQERAAQDQSAAGHSELPGHESQTERAYGRVEALDALLARMDRMEADQ
jgi:hypothetical protein